MMTSFQPKRTNPGHRVESKEQPQGQSNRFSHLGAEVTGDIPIDRQVHQLEPTEVSNKKKPSPNIMPKK